MKAHIVPSLLILTVCVATPVSANWFANPALGINLHVGTAPSPTPEDVRSGKRPMLVRDADGNIIAMIDPSSGKVIATAEPPPRTQALQSNSTAARKPAPAR
jgi:hypothetical protein